MAGFSSGSGSGSASASGYLEPHHVYELVIRLMPRELLDYLDSIPGSSRDLHCNWIKAVAKTLGTLLSQPPRLPLPELSKKILRWAQLARSYAIDSRLCAPQVVGNPSNSNSDAGPNMNPQKSSCSARMLTSEPGSKELKHSAPNLLSASSSRTPAATLLPLQEKYHDVHRHASIHNQVSASSSGVQAAMPPLQEKTKKGRMGSPSARRFRAVSRHGGSPQPTVTSPPSPASSKRDRGAPQPRRAPRPAPTSLSSPPPTSPAHTSLTSPRRPCRRARRPLRSCQRRILTQPSEAMTAPPRRSLRLASAYARGTLGSWSFRQTIEKERVYYSEDDGGAEREHIIKSWSDEDEDVADYSDDDSDGADYSDDDSDGADYSDD